MFKRFWWVFLAMLPAGTLAGFVVAAVITYVVPKKYESQVTIEVKPISNGESVRPSSNPVEIVCGTEFDKIESRALLVSVIENLELANKWRVDQETAVQILKRIVTYNAIRGTDLISIQVRHTDREDARNIAAEVAKVYRDWRNESESRVQDRYLSELNKAVRDQEDNVEEERKVLATIPENSNRYAGRSDDQIIRRGSSPDYMDAKRDFETDVALLQQLKLKLISATIENKIPRESVVTHEEPLISNVPVSPNVTLNLVLGGVIGFLISPLLALPLMWMLNRLNPVKEGRTSADPG